MCPITCNARFTSYIPVIKVFTKNTAGKTVPVSHYIYLYIQIVTLHLEYAI